MVANGAHIPLVVFDQLLVKRRPDLLVAFRIQQPHCTSYELDLLATPKTNTHDPTGARPDAVIVASEWLHLVELLHRVLETRGWTGSRVLLATDHLDDIFRAQAVHRGFSHQLDLRLSSEQLGRHLCQASGPATSPANVPLWNSLPLPAIVPHARDTANDDTDRAILDLVSVGMQDCDIGNVVHASTQTVKNRISAMLTRSGCRNRTQLAWMHSNDALTDVIIHQLAERP